MSKEDKDAKKLPVFPIMILALFLGTIVLGNQKAPKSRGE